MVVLIGLWYAALYAVVRPLAPGPVIDDWLYVHAVQEFARTGRIAFGGFTQAMPVSQVLYGALWAKFFGASYVSLHMAGAVLGMAGTIAFYALARDAGLEPARALTSSALLACNPCYVLLSFSFMTDVAFVAVLLAACWALGRSRRDAEVGGSAWLAAALLVVAFLVRFLAAVAIAGFVAAIATARSREARAIQGPRRIAARTLVPLGVALMLSAAAWAWLTMMHPKPWALRLDEQHFRWLLLVTPLSYFKDGILNPLLYLGAVLSPLGIPAAMRWGWKRALGWSALLFVTATVLIRAYPKLPVMPEFSCCGAWRNALQLPGLSGRFLWTGAWQWPALALSCLGASALIMAAERLHFPQRRGVTALLASALFYLIALIPLWFFNDRYYLPLVPAGALMLALAGPELRSVQKWAVLSLTAVMGLTSLGGLYAYQRGLSRLIAERDALVRAGIPRANIDAGYPLNGADLYRWVNGGMDTMQSEKGIPMITAPEAASRYVLAAAPMTGAEVVRTLIIPGPFGLSSRKIYVLQRPSIRRRAGSPAQAPRTTNPAGRTVRSRSGAIPVPNRSD